MQIVKNLFTLNILLNKTPLFTKTHPSSRLSNTEKSVDDPVGPCKRRRFQLLIQPYQNYTHTLVKTRLSMN